MPKGIPDLEPPGAGSATVLETTAGQADHPDAELEHTEAAPVSSVLQAQVEVVPVQSVAVEPQPQAQSSPAVVSVAQSEVQSHPEFLNAHDRLVIEKAERAISKMVRDGDKNAVEVFAKQVLEIEQAIKRETGDNRHTELVLVRTRLLSDSERMPVALQDALKIALDKYSPGLGR